MDWSSVEYDFIHCTSCLFYTHVYRVTQKHVSKCHNGNEKEDSVDHHSRSITHHSGLYDLLCSCKATGIQNRISHITLDRSHVNEIYIGLLYPTLTIDIFFQTSKAGTVRTNHLITTQKMERSFFDRETVKAAPEVDPTSALPMPILDEAKEPSEELEEQRDPDCPLPSEKNPSSIQGTSEC
jgi:hypothetical protein